MRALQTKDLGLFSKIISKMEVKKDIKDMFVDVTDKTEEELDRIEQQLGVQMIMVLVENYWKAEQEVYTLLSNLTDRKKKEIEELPLSEFIELLMKLKDDESFQLFFNLVAK